MAKLAAIHWVGTQAESLGQAARDERLGARRVRLGVTEVANHEEPAFVQTQARRNRHQRITHRNPMWLLGHHGVPLVVGCR